MFISAARARPALATALMLCTTTAALSHGIVGNRFFPATITTDDPFVNDELALPTVSRQRTGDDPSVSETDIHTEFSKRITPDFGVSLGYGWMHLDQAGPPHNPSGFRNLEITPQYQILRDAPHEALLKLGIISEIGGTGTQRIGADRFTTLTPTLYFGKGAGDLPETLDWLRPFAVTGTFGYSVPTRKKTSTTFVDPDTGEVSLAIDHHSNALQYGLAIEYSLPYLTANIRDLGLPSWMNRLTPLVEFSFTQPITDRLGELTVGTINPGVIWSGQYVQFGVEAIIPATRPTGKALGIIAQVHFYLDDIFPDTIGRPVIGR